MRSLAVERIARIQMAIGTAGRLPCATRPGRTPLQLVPGCNGQPYSLKTGAGLEKNSVQQQLMRRENVDPPDLSTEWSVLQTHSQFHTSACRPVRFQPPPGIWSIQTPSPLPFLINL